MNLLAFLFPPKLPVLNSEELAESVAYFTRLNRKGVTNNLLLTTVKVIGHAKEKR